MLNKSKRVVCSVTNVGLTSSCVVIYFLTLISRICIADFFLWWTCERVVRKSESRLQER